MFSTTPKRSQFKEFESTFLLIESILGFLPNSTLYMSENPAIMMSFMMLSKSIMKQHEKVTFGSKIKNLLKFIKSMIKSDQALDTLSLKNKWLIAYAASQAAGCFYCQKHTHHSLEKLGVSPQQLEQIFTFRNSALFTDEEKAVIDLGIASGSVPNATQPQHFKTLAKYFSKKEILTLVSVSALFGFLNRWNSTLNTPLEEIFSAKKN